MKVESFKGRKIDTNKKVRVYRNLMRKGVVWSIKQDGLVVGHAEEIVVSKAKSFISRSGQDRAVREKERNVHAFIEGYVAYDSIDIESMKRISYNPFKNKEFVVQSTGTSVIDMGIVKFCENGVFIN